MRRLALALLVLAVGLVAACGGSDNVELLDRGRQGRARERQADLERDGRRHLPDQPRQRARGGRQQARVHLRRPDALQRPRQAAVARLEARLQLRLQQLHQPRGLDRQQRLHPPRRRGLRARRAERRAHQPERGVGRQGRRARRGRARPARRGDGREGERRGRGRRARRRRATRARSTSTRRSTRSRASSASVPAQATGGQGVPAAPAHARARARGQGHVPVASLRDPGGGRRHDPPDGADHPLRDPRGQPARPPAGSPAARSSTAWTTPASARTSQSRP